MSAPPPRIVSAQAVELASMPRLARALFVAHKPDRFGNCVICRERGIALPYPCGVSSAAAAACALIDHVALSGRTVRRPDGSAVLLPRTT